MFDEIPISTIKLHEGRFQTFLDIPLSEDVDESQKQKTTTTPTLVKSFNNVI